MSITAAANCPSPADESLRGPGGPADSDGFSTMGTRRNRFAAAQYDLDRRLRNR
jgi:hypothetical protein